MFMLAAAQSADTNEQTPSLLGDGRCCPCHELSTSHPTGEGVAADGRV
jgi:hypothetical protein